MIVSDSDVLAHCKTGTIPSPVSRSVREESVEARDCEVDGLVGFLAGTGGVGAGAGAG